jgi:hypothetical protein
MLVYLDESYREAKTPNCKSTIAAICIPEAKYRAFELDLFRLEKHFWKVQEPTDLELKGRLLMSEHAIELPKNREFIRQLIALLKEYGIVPFAVVEDGSIPLATLKPDHLPALYRAILRRIDRFMVEKQPDDHAILFFDGIDHQTNQKVAVSFTRYMFRHQAGIQHQHILPVPNFSDSLVTPGIQLADVIAYCMNERHVGHAKRGHLEDFFLEFRNLTFTYENPDEDFVLWGFQRTGTGKYGVDEPETPEDEAQPELL